MFGIEGAETLASGGAGFSSDNVEDGNVANIQCRQCQLSVPMEYSKVKIEEFIPVALVKPVAEVLKWGNSLNDAVREQRELDEIDLN